MEPQTSQDNVAVQIVRYNPFDGSGKNVYPGKNDRIPFEPGYRHFLMINGMCSREMFVDFIPGVYDRKRLFSKDARDVCSLLKIYAGTMHYSTKLSVRGPTLEEMVFDVGLDVMFDISELPEITPGITCCVPPLDTLQDIKAILQMFMLKNRDYSPEESVMRVGKTDYLLSTMNVERLKAYLDEMVMPEISLSIRKSIPSFNDPSYGDMDRIVSEALANDLRVREHLRMNGLRLACVPRISHEPTKMEMLRREHPELSFEKMQ